MKMHRMWRKTVKSMKKKKALSRTKKRVMERERWKEGETLSLVFFFCFPGIFFFVVGFCLIGRNRGVGGVGGKEKKRKEILGVLVVLLVQKVNKKVTDPSGCIWCGFVAFSFLHSLFGFREHGQKEKGMEFWIYCFIILFWFSGVRKRKKTHKGSLIVLSEVFLHFLFVLYRLFGWWENGEN